MMIDDRPRTFNVDGILCAVSATNFLRVSNDRIMESRELSCWIEKDTYVSITVTCRLPEYEGGSFYLKQRDLGYAPVLTCGPHR
jgi:hypothetical protein